MPQTVPSPRARSDWIDGQSAPTKTRWISSKFRHMQFKFMRIYGVGIELLKHSFTLKGLGTFRSYRTLRELLIRRFKIHLAEKRNTFFSYT